MVEQRAKALLGKIAVRGTIECVTGLHIGGSKENLDIGGIDAPIVRDPLSRQPYIPGSSLKGKLRALVERVLGKEFNRYSGQGVHRHECSDSACPVCRLFGSTTSGGGSMNMPSRLIVRDCQLTTQSRQHLSQLDTGLHFAEWKFENALDRVSACANPRQLERVPSGVAFDFEIVYNVEVDDPEVVERDILNLFLAMGLLEDDYLGGHGSRGYGRVRWQPRAFVGRTLAYYSATSADERAASEIGAQVDSLDACREKIQDMVLGLLDAAAPAETSPSADAEPQPPAEDVPQTQTDNPPSADEEKPSDEPSAPES